MGSAYVRARQIITATGERPLLDGVVVTEERNITYVGPAAAAPSPYPNARAFKVDTVLPGLINSHVHLSMSETDTKRPTTVLPGTELERCIAALQRAQACLERGITTVRDVGSPDAGIFALRDSIDRGEHTASRIFAAGRLLCCTGGHAYRLGRQTDGADGFRRAAREEIRAGADLIKIVADGGSSDPRAPLEHGISHLMPAELAAAVDAAHAMGKPTTAHALGRATIHAALEAGVDAVEHAYALDDAAIEIIVKQDVFFIPTVMVYESSLRHGDETGQHVPWVDQLRRVRDMSHRGVTSAIKAGVRIASGTDGGSPFNPHHNLVEELRSLHDLGMSSLSVIESATRRGAELLRAKERLGTLEVGKLADLIATVGDPLHDLSLLGQPRLVMKEGQVVLASSEVANAGGIATAASLR